LLVRLAALLCVVAFSQNVIAQCAGWQPTPEARRDCCRSGACPLQRHGHGAGKAITQQMADDCCSSASQHRDSSPSPSNSAPAMTLAVLHAGQAVAVVETAAIAMNASWSRETPSPPAHVPKHLLLSVLLV